MKTMQGDNWSRHGERQTPIETSNTLLIQDIALGVRVACLDSDCKTRSKILSLVENSGEKATRPESIIPYS